MRNRIIKRMISFTFLRRQNIPNTLLITQHETIRDQCVYYLMKRSTNGKATFDSSKWKKRMRVQRGNLKL